MASRHHTNGHSITTTLARKHYVATEAEVESLAQEQYRGADIAANGASTYLRVLVAGCQAKVGRARRGLALRKDAQLEVIGAVHERYYAAVLRGVTTADIEHDANVDSKEQRRRTLERNRRSAFARSAVSTLRLYVNGGGDIRALEVETVSKTQLRKAVAPTEPTDKTERQIQRAEGALLRAIERRARASPEQARDDIERVMEDLQKTLDALNGEAETAPAEAPAAPPPRQDTGARRTRVGVPLLHRPALAAGP